MDRASFARSNERLGVEFDNIFTAEDIRSYKPDPRNLPLLQNLDCEKSRNSARCATLFHDINPASEAGLDTAWIDRQGLTEGGSWGATAKIDKPLQAGLTFDSLLQFADFACEFT